MLNFIHVSVYRKTARFILFPMFSLRSCFFITIVSLCRYNHVLHPKACIQDGFDNSEQNGPFIKIKHISSLLNHMTMDLGFVFALIAGVLLLLCTFCIWMHKTRTGRCQPNQRIPMKSFFSPYKSSSAALPSDSSDFPKIRTNLSMVPASTRKHLNRHVGVPILESP